MSKVRIAVLAATSLLVLGSIYISGKPKPKLEPKPEPQVTAAAVALAPLFADAIKAAVPEIPDLMKRLWKKADDKEYKKKELETSLVSVREDLIKEAKQKIQPISVVSSELDVSMKFLAPTVAANQHIIDMRARLVNPPAAGDANLPTFWSDLKTSWEKAKLQLSDIDKIPVAEINVMREISLREKLKEVRDVNRDLKIDVDAALARENLANIAQLRDHLNRLSSILRVVTGIVGSQMTDLSRDIKNLAESAKPEAAANPKDKFQQFLQENIQ